MQHLPSNLQLLQQFGGGFPFLFHGLKLRCKSGASTAQIVARRVHQHEGMQETAIRFLMKDGAARYTFKPALTPHQYAELAAIVREKETVAELSQALQRFAARWELALTIDPA